MRKTEKKEVTSKQEVTIGYKCDCCEKEIVSNNLPNEWHNFNSHHDEWGNDSVDSYKYYDVCSPKCYKEQMIKIVEGEYKNRKLATIDEKDIAFARLLVESFKSVADVMLSLPSQEEIDEHIDKYAFRVPYDGSNNFYDEVTLKHYKAGIEWLLNRFRGNGA